MPGTRAGLQFQVISDSVKARRDAPRIVDIVRDRTAERVGQCFAKNQLIPERQDFGDIRHRSRTSVGRTKKRQRREGDGQTCEISGEKSGHGGAEICVSPHPSQSAAVGLLNPPVKGFLHHLRGGFESVPHLPGKNFWISFRAGV